MKEPKKGPKTVPPPKPLSTFFLFVADRRTGLKKEHPSWDKKKIIKNLKNQWQKNSNEEQ
jgi:hypothetical protein